MQLESYFGFSVKLRVGDFLLQEEDFKVPLILIYKYLFMANVITDTNFEELISGELPVVVDFWATWCGPCLALAPTIEALASDYEGKVVVGKCNIDENPELPMKYRIRNIPTVLFFKNGELVDRLVGSVPKSQLAEKIESLL